MSVAAAAALGACGTTSVNHDTADGVAASIAQLLDLPAFKELPKELQDGDLQALWEKHARLQAHERGPEGHQRPAPGNQTVSGVLHDCAASGTAGAGARQSTPSLGIIYGGRDVQAQSFLPASQAAAAQAAADAFTERLRAGSESTLQAVASAAAPARARSLDTAAATNQGCRPAGLAGGQAGLDMSALERLRGCTSGAVYVVARGSRGAGFFGDWSTCGVTGCSGAVYRKFEFNQRSTGGKKYKSFAACEEAAIDYLLTQECTPSQVAAGLRAVIDEREAAAAAVAQKERVREEAERARRVRERAEAAQAAAREAAAREAAAGERAVREHLIEHHSDCAVEDVLREAAAEVAAEALVAAAKQKMQRRAEARLAEERRASARRRAARDAAAREALRRDAAMRCVCAQVAAAACSAVLANYPRRDRGDHVRSTAAKRKRRRSKAPTGVAGTAQVAGAATASDSSSRPAADAAGAPAEMAGLRAELLRANALRAAAEARVKDRDQLLRKERRRLRREGKTADRRARQDERRSGKAKARHRKVRAARGVDGAARRDKERKRKRKALPDGEPLHSGERKRQRLLEQAAGSGKGRAGGGKGGGRGGRGGRGSCRGGGGSHSRA